MHIVEVDFNEQNLKNAQSLYDTLFHMNQPWNILLMIMQAFCSPWLTGVLIVNLTLRSYFQIFLMQHQNAD